LLQTNSGIQKSFARILTELPTGYIRDMESYGLYDGDLTAKGVRYLKSIAEEHEGEE